MRAARRLRNSFSRPVFARWQTREVPMAKLLRLMRWLLAMALAGTIGTLPACGSMGGGMKYLLEVPWVSTVS